MLRENGSRHKMGLDINLLMNFIYKLFSAMEQFEPIDATTNPSLILAAANLEKYAHLIDKAVQYGKKSGS